MAKYFNIMDGLRGCYMPNSSYVTRCETRRELKAVLEFEARNIRDSYVGCNKKQVAWLAATMWKEAQKKNPAYLPHVAPYGEKGNYHSAIHVSVATRKEYLESQDNDSND
jgi:hypothetical protein